VLRVFYRKIIYGEGMSQSLEGKPDDRERLLVPHHLQQPRLIEKGGVLVVQAHPVGDLLAIAREEREARIRDLLRHTGE
jgi:hypothetical protein